MTAFPASLRPWEDVLRKAGVGAGLGVVVAVVNGPTGTQNDPLLGLRRSLSPVRLLGYVAVLAAVGAAFGLAARLPLAAARTRVDEGFAPVRAVVRRREVRWAALVVLLLLAVLLPRGVAPFYQTVLTNSIAPYVLLALGLNVVVGFAGLLDLGYIAFYAIGAYSAAYWSGRLPVEPPFEPNLFFVFVLGLAAAMVAGIVLGAPTLRLRGDYLAIVTLGFGEIVRISLVNADEVTAGPPGVIGIPKFNLDIGPLEYRWTSKALPYYYLALGLIVITAFAFARLNDSRVGRAWAAIREDEVAAAASGVATVKYKLLAFSIGASTAGVAGVFYASRTGFVSPANFPLLFSILVLVYVIFGGMGSIIGVAFGAAVLEFMPHYLSGKVDPDDRFIYFGALLVVMMIFRPQGVLPSKRRQRELTHGSGDALGGAGAGAAEAVTPL